ncbi:hypothetical protein J6590_046087 [Homalodisca vitripennis]|nr:hypothetical protein J6590_046087 [Homalodisca vitripennis]
MKVAVTTIMGLSGVSQQSESRATRTVEVTGCYQRGWTVTPLSRSVLSARAAGNDRPRADIPSVINNTARRRTPSHATSASLIENCFSPVICEP